jgi:predicted signal transduction protein with EAL and GGDEF domain
MTTSPPFWTRLWPRRIGRRLALGFGALVVLMLLALSQAGLQLRQVSEVTQKFATGDMQRLLRVQALSLLTEGVGSAMVRLMNAPRADRVAEYGEVDERNRRIDGIIESLGNDLKDTEQEETLKRLRACRAQYADAFIAAVDEVEAEDLKAAAKVLNERVNPSLKAMLTESNALLARERERIEKQLSTAQAQFAEVAWWVGILSVLVTVFAAGLAWRTTRSVVIPLGALESAANRIALGNYTSRLSETHTEEVDRVGSALNTMAEAVAQREQQIVRLAYQDALTGLPNRTSLLNPMQPGPIHNTMALLDLARLKVINETLGYSTGDTLIQQLAIRAAEVLAQAAQSGCIGPSPVFARLSGGTFAAYFTAPNRAAVEVVRQQLDDGMREPVICSGYSVDLGLACGFADLTGQFSQVPVTTLMRNAEVALHSAKRAALGHAWHNEVQEAARLGHLNLLSDLRRAVVDSQLQMWLQPKFSLITGRAVGAEALVRWHHPTRGFVSPAEFVPFAEQTGYITLVTDWMLRQALLTLKAWEARQPELTIAVNVSTRDLQDNGFFDRVESMLSQSGVNLGRLRMEITESGLMEDAKSSVALMHRLRDLGVPLSIDDFGTGYSSLAYLQKLPVSELKIDRSFIDGIDALPGTQKLVKAMIEMGHSMGLSVTAEGVETKAERDTITGLACDVMQGYFASRPLHGQALTAWFDSLEPAQAGESSLG